MADNRKMSAGWGEGKGNGNGIKGTRASVTVEFHFHCYQTRRDNSVCNESVETIFVRELTGNSRLQFYGFRNFRFYDKNRAPRHAIKPVSPLGAR